MSRGAASAAPFIFSLADATAGSHHVRMSTTPDRLRLLSANIQAGSSTRAYREYVTRSWSHVLPNGKRLNLDGLATLAQPYDVVGLQESDPGSLRSGFVRGTRCISPWRRSRALRSSASTGGWSRRPVPSESRLNSCRSRAAVPEEPRIDPAGARAYKRARA